MAPSIWKLSFRPSDTSSPREITVEGDTWQAALAAGRAQLGQSGPLATAATVVSPSGEVTLLDPTTGHHYVLRPSAPDNAANAEPPPVRTPTIMPAPSQARAQQTLPYSSERAAALEREFALAQATSGASSRPPAQGLPSRPASASAPSSTSKAPMHAGPSQHASASSSLPPPSAALEALARPGLRAVPDPPPSPAEPRPTSEPVVLLVSRDVERSGQSTLTYRERAYLLPGGGSREQLEQLLRGKLSELQAELSSRPRGKYVTLAVFDHRPDEAAPHAPLATLEWKDWRGSPVFALPVEEPSPNSSVRAPTGAPSRAQGADSGELDARLASAFEAMHDLHFTATPLAALELAVGLLERLVPCEALSGCLYDLDTDEFRFVAVTGPGASERRASAVPAADGLIGAALRIGDEVLVVHKAANDGRFDAAIDGRLGLQVDELAYVPVRQHGQLFGILQLINRASAGGFSEPDVAVLSYVAGQLSRFFAERRGTNE